MSSTPYFYSVRLLLIVGSLLSWVFSCNSPENINVIPESDLETKAPLMAYRGAVGEQLETFSLAVGTQLQLRDGAAYFQSADPYYNQALLQPVIFDGDSCWVPINLPNVFIPSKKLDSLRVEQTARLLLTNNGDLFRYRAFSWAMEGKLDRPLTFLLTEGDRLAAQFSAIGGGRLNLLQSMQQLAGPLIAGYRLIVRDTQSLYVRHWPSWQLLADRPSAHDWQQELVSCLQVNYGQDTLADPQSLIWWLYTEEAERYHRLGDSSTVNSLARMANLVKQETAAFALSLDMAEQAVRPLSAEGLKFWNSQEAILWELDSILATDWSIIPDRERIALGVLRDRLLAPDTSGIRLDYRSGRFD
ncbi:MAG: hypothetical protein AAF433_10820 [Bacteroidota bacterium]